MNSDAVLGLMNASWPVLLVDEAGTILSANITAIQAFGPDIGSGSASLASITSENQADSLARILEHWQKTPLVATAARLRNLSGVSANCQVIICLLPDEEKKRFLMQLLPAPIAAEVKNALVESSMAHKQKLDCALQLARTVSLDFNNALTSILGHTSLVLSKMEPTNPLRQSLMEVEKSAAKAAEIANDLGAFSRQEKEMRVQQSGNLNQLLERNVETFQRAKLDKEITWSLQLERRLRTAKFDEAKLQQALMKVIENAIEALNPRGNIIIQTKNLNLTQPTQDRNAQLAAGSYVCVEITDDGSGIEADVLPRIFEPFFTTKRGGKHRGLGLAWVYGIVTNHGGGVAVSSQSGAGTSVRVYLPADQKLIRETSHLTTDLNGTETVLIVDDEDLLLTMGQTILSHYGYRVLTAKSGAKGLDIINSNDPPIDLLITDLVMPNMSGRELTEKVRQVAPSIRILCMSGYVWPVSEEDQPAAYLQKPFTSQEFLRKVKQILSPVEPAHVD